MFLIITSWEWLGHLGVSWALFALIWVIQLVHYPSFHYVEEAKFPKFHGHHTRSITLIVMPLMLLELGLTIWQVGQSNFQWQWIIPLLLVLLIWASTFLIQIPLHSSLTEKKSDDIQKLVSTNWIRTLLWTIKALWLSLLFIE